MGNLEETLDGFGDRYFWSPTVRWEQKENDVRIEVFSYKGYAAKLFPRFYFLTQKGVFLKDLIAEFPEVDPQRLLVFCKDLIRKRVLVNTILTAPEIFYPQGYLFQNKYSDDIKYDAKALNKFREKHLSRTCENCSSNKLKLSNPREYPAFISERRSYRDFDQESRVSFEQLSSLLSVLKQVRNGEHIKYYYASAGGLYPIDVYIYAKANRIENVDKGLYYYSPLDNSLSLVDNTVEIPDDAHYYTNQQIFRNSAFSIFLFYNAEVTMPKYDGMGYLYAFIDAGIMVGGLTLAAELCNLGLCSIGDMNFRKIEKYFELSKNQVFIHSIEGGVKPAILVDPEESMIF